MTIQIELYQALMLAIGLISFVGGLVVWAGRMLLAQVELRLDQRFELLQKTRDDMRAQCMNKFGAIDGERMEERQQWQRVERDLLQLRADLPLHYVRREDYVRGQTVIEAKIDAVVLKLENLQLRATPVPVPGDRRRYGVPEPIHHAPENPAGGDNAEPA